MSVGHQFKKLLQSVTPALLSGLTTPTSGLAVLGYSLPVFAKGIFNKALSEIPGFDGSVDSVGLRLLSGRIEIKNIVFNKKITRETSEPFLFIPQISLSLSWRRLFQREIVGEIVIEKPSVVMNVQHWKDHSPARPDAERRHSPETTWQGQLKQAIRFHITKVSIKQGTLELSHLLPREKQSFCIQDLDLEINNLTNSPTLAATSLTTAKAKGRITSEGVLEWQAEAYLLEASPSFSTSLKLRKIALKEYASIIRHYFNIELAEGTLDVFAEGEALDGKFKGYVKPIFDDLRIQSIRRPTLWTRFKTAIAKGLVRVLRNNEQDRIATRINFEGSFSDPRLSWAAIVSNFVKNAMGSAFKARLDFRLLNYFRQRAVLERHVSYTTVRKPSQRWAGMLKESFSRWMEHDVPRMSAALSYYTCFSLAPLLLLLIAIVGLVFGREAARGQIAAQLTALVGKQSAETIQTMIAAAWQPSKGIAALFISVGTLLIGAFGVLSELKSGLNRVMKVSEKGSIGEIVIDRAKYLGFILGIGFLLMVSLAVSTVLAALGQALAALLPFPNFILQGIDLVLSVGVIALLFAMIFRFLPNCRLSWRSIGVGSFFTAVLFAGGKFGLGLYLGRTSTVSSYGAAGSLLIVLLWVYYSALISYYGAEFTKVYSESEK